ncbi:Gfo/Idh/MocA family oxidoreductase [Oerskovia sp. M15]
MRAFTQGHVAAVGSRDEHRARDFAQRHAPSATVHGSYEALVADPDVDVVYVATPHSHHRDHGLLAIAAGKPVLMEKAFTRNEAEAREVLEAARAADVFVMEAMLTRHLPHVAAIRALIAQGEIGEVRSVTAGYGSNARYDPASGSSRPSSRAGRCSTSGSTRSRSRRTFSACPTTSRLPVCRLPRGRRPVDRGAAVRGPRDGDARLVRPGPVGDLARDRGDGGRIEVMDRFMVPTTFDLVGPTARAGCTTGTRWAPSSTRPRRSRAASRRADREPPHDVAGHAGPDAGHGLGARAAGVVYPGE